VQLRVTFNGGETMRMYLINARKSKNLTQEYVADRTGITRQYYGMIENGERTPSVNIAKIIGSILEINWIIFFESDRNLGLPNGVNSDVTSTS
jgi:putative transcriptional regulator